MSGSNNRHSLPLGWLNSSTIKSVASYKSANATTSTATLGTTGLSVTVETGKKYYFNIVLFLNQSIGADGANVDLNGGTATKTNLIYAAQLIDDLNGFLDFTTQSTFNAPLTVATFGVGKYELFGTIEVNAGGTIIPRYAVSSHSTGVLTLNRGSYIILSEIP